MDIVRHYDEIAHCNKCGFCQTACPIFRSTGHESGVARGRLALIRAIIEDRLEWNRELEEPLFDCLLCGACTANCFPAIPTSDLIIAARAEYQERVGRKKIHRLLFEYLLPYPRRLHLAARAAALGKNSGFSRMAAAIGLLRIFGQDFEKAQEIIETFAPLPFRDRVKPGFYAGSGDSLEIAYFVGCGVDILRQEAGDASLGRLRALGQRVTVLPNCCCGLPAWTYGDITAARRLAEKNIAAIRPERYDLIVSDCSSCAAFLKKYPRLFPAGDPLNAKAKRLVKKIRDITEILEPGEPGPCKDEKPVTITYHDPCHASRGQALVQQPRNILKGLSGVHYLELPEADWCCGGAGSYALSHYSLSRRVLDRKIANIAKTGAQIVATSCPACMIHLSYGIRKHGLDVQVKHISEIVKDKLLDCRLLGASGFGVNRMKK
jgi:glycolate oxidase iron-sulfur subunit